MRTRSGVALTVAALGTVVATATPSYAASATVHSTLSSPYDVAVTSTLEPNPSGATHSTVAVTRPIGGVFNPAPVPAGDLAVRWALYYIPNGATNWQLCKLSDPNQFYSFSPNVSSTYGLNNSAFRNPAQTACGDGIYGLLTDGLAYVNGGWHGALNVYSGPEALQGSTPGGGPVVLLQLNAARAAVAAAKAHTGNVAAASAAAAGLNAAAQTDALASAKAATATRRPPSLKAVKLPARAR